MSNFKFYATKALLFASLCLFVLAAIGGVGYLFYFGKALFAIAVLFVVGLSLPRVREIVAHLLDGEND